LLLSSCSSSEPQSALNPAGPEARTINHLWILVFTLAAIVFFIVEGALLFTIFRWRSRRGDKGDGEEPVQVHGNTRLEIIWTIIPVVLLAFVAVPMVRGVFSVRAVAQGSDVLEVQVTGHQWWWEFEYVNLPNANGRTIDTANELVIPEDTKVNLTMTSADVIHSFWVPTLNGKRDVVPNRISNLTLIADDPTPPGQPHPGQCAEYCGVGHADMRFKVYVDTKTDFDAWVQEQLQPAVAPTDGAAATGFDTFKGTCTACHDATVAGSSGPEDIGPVRTLEVDGVTFRSSLAPNLTHFASRSTFAAGVLDNTTDHLAQWLADPSSVKSMRPDLNDIPNGRILGMPNYNLSSDDINNLITLLEGWK
jgi:cytochrome c oxidase subunit 2